MHPQVTGDMDAGEARARCMWRTQVLEQSINDEQHMPIAEKIDSMTLEGHTSIRLLQACMHACTCPTCMQASCTHACMHLRHTPHLQHAPPWPHPWPRLLSCWPASARWRKQLLLWRYQAPRCHSGRTHCMRHLPRGLHRPAPPADPCGPDSTWGC